MNLNFDPKVKLFAQQPEESDNMFDEESTCTEGESDDGWVDLDLDENQL